MKLQTSPCEWNNINDVGNCVTTTLTPGQHAHRQHGLDSFYLAALMYMTKLRP